MYVVDLGTRIVLSDAADAIDDGIVTIPEETMIAVLWRLVAEDKKMALLSRLLPI
jgi:hypothetical protein